MGMVVPAECFPADRYSDDWLRERVRALLLEDDEVVAIDDEPAIGAAEAFYPLYVHYENGATVAVGVFPADLRVTPLPEWDTVLAAVAVDVVVQPDGSYRLTD